MTIIEIYRQVGYKFGAWHDVAWYGMRLWGRSGAPSPSRSRTASSRVDDEGQAPASSTARGLISSNVGGVLARST